jgi:pimeloyl-ACP methyl ester carboxylesterase
LAEPAGVAALKAAVTHLLPVPAAHAMLPGNVAHEAAMLDVPILVVAGEFDIVGPVEEVPAAFTASPSAELHVMPGSGHSHFLFPARLALFEHLGRWARVVTHN